MNEQGANFGRSFSVTISDSQSAVVYESQNNQSDYDGRNYADMRITFSIQRTQDTKTPDVATIKIYNPFEHVELSMKDNPVVIVEAGYAGIVSTVFQGNVKSLNWGREGNNIVVTIQSGDGERAINTMQYTAKPPKYDMEKMIDEQIGTLKNVGLDIASGAKDLMKTALSGESVNFGSLITGSVVKNIKKQLQPKGYTIDINNNMLSCRELFKADETPALYLSPETGLIGTPTVGTKKFKTGKGKAKRNIEKTTVKFKAQLMAGFETGRQVQIESEFISGRYAIDSCNITADTKGGAWEVNCEAIIL